MRHLSIRNVPADLGDALLEAKRARGRSLNQTVLDLLAESVGLAGYGSRSNGLRDLAGGWSAEEHAAFEHAVSDTERLDEELWR